MSESSTTTPAAKGSAAGKADGIIVCPYCHDSVPVLTRIEAGMKLRLQESAQISSPPDAVCDGCHRMLTKMISKGAVLRAEQQAKEQNRLLLWRNRVSLVKQAKAHLAQKNFNDAAVAYEKYLRVLEIIYEVKSGELKPELFKNDSRSQEMTVIATVYWDLMRIYDTHNRYRDRQMKAADKLAEFVRFTPIFGHIMRRAESQARNSKNPDAFRKFLKMSNAKRPRCFIATSAYDGYMSETVQALCSFRDNQLKTSPMGRKFIVLYYRISPSLASWLDRHPSWKPVTRKVLTWVANHKIVRNNLNT